MNRSSRLSTYTSVGLLPNRSRHNVTDSALHQTVIQYETITQPAVLTGRQHAVSTSDDALRRQVDSAADRRRRPIALQSLGDATVLSTSQDATDITSHGVINSRTRDGASLSCDETTDRQRGDLSAAEHRVNKPTEDQATEVNRLVELRTSSHVGPSAGVLGRTHDLQTTTNGRFTLVARSVKSTAGCSRRDANRCPTNDSDKQAVQDPIQRYIDDEEFLENLRMFSKRLQLINVRNCRSRRVRQRKTAAAGTGTGTDSSVVCTSLCVVGRSFVAETTQHKPQTKNTATCYNEVLSMIQQGKPRRLQGIFNVNFAHEPVAEATADPLADREEETVQLCGVDVFQHWCRGKISV